MLVDFRSKFLNASAEQGDLGNEFFHTLSIHISMGFKQWLILEDGDEGSDWFYGSSLYPTDASDWRDAAGDPSEMSLLQSRWKKERDDWGRKFHGLEPQTTIDQKFISIYSNTMPEAGDGHWKHRADDRPNLKIDNDAKLALNAFRTRADVSSVVYKSNPLVDKTDELNKLFGEFKPNDPDLPTNFDEPWLPSTKWKYRKKKQYPSYVNNLG